MSITTCPEFEDRENRILDTFINLCVADIKRSRAFFTALGFSFNEQFCSDDTLGMEIGASSTAMLLSPEKFASFTNGRAIADPAKATEVLTALRYDTREEVDAIMEKALANGGSEFRAPEEHGFMYGRSFADPDGHVWEPFWFDQSTLQETSS